MCTTNVRHFQEREMIVTDQNPRAQQPTHMEMSVVCDRGVNTSGCSFLLRQFRFLIPTDDLHQ